MRRTHGVAPHEIAIFDTKAATPVTTIYPSSHRDKGWMEAKQLLCKDMMHVSLLPWVSTQAQL